MLGDRWICDRETSERFPGYTRGNAGEVLAEPVSPLAWTFCWEPGPVQGCVDGFEQMGIIDRIEYRDPYPESFGLFGGYFYNSLTQARLFGVRSGAGWQAIDNAYFDPESQEIPEYVEQDWHVDECKTKKLTDVMGWVTTTPSFPEAELQKLEAKSLRDSRPDLSTQSDTQLLARAFSIQRHLRAQFSSVVWASMGSATGPGILAELLAGAPEDISALITGIGDVDSADIAAQIFAISRVVKDSSDLMSEFDGDLDGLLERVGASDSDDAQAFTAAVDAFMYKHGARGPNEWDIYQRSYETKPLLLLQAVERARHADDKHDPAATVSRGAAERKRLIDKYTEMFADNAEALGGFQVAVNSAQVWMAARERIKSSNIRCHHEVRLCFDELGRRAAERGHLRDARHVYMLVADELDDFMSDASRFTDTLAERHDDYLSLYDIVPPYSIDGDVPPLSEWERRGGDSFDKVAVGDVLSGVAGSPGTHTGRARVMLDLSDPSVLEPDDIMIAPSTDPSWTPLFLVAGAVITDIGAVGTHAVIVSRELGIPCVPSIADATKRIPDGATITVDGAAGTVTIDALP